MTLEERVRRLEDIQDITNLKAAYCNLCDGGWDRPAMGDAEAIAALFTEDGTWDFGSTLPTVKGHSQIAALMRALQVWPFAFHNHIVPSIHVDGDEASAKWHGINLVTMPDIGAQWSVGIYDERYRRTGSGWKFSLVRFTRIFRTSFHVDWAKDMKLFQHDRLGREFKIPDEISTANRSI